MGHRATRFLLDLLAQKACGNTCARSSPFDVATRNAADHPGPTHLSICSGSGNLSSSHLKLKSIPCDIDELLDTATFQCHVCRPIQQTEALYHSEPPMTFLLPEGVSDTFRPMVAVSASSCNIFTAAVKAFRHSHHTSKFHRPVGPTSSPWDRTWSSRETALCHQAAESRCSTEVNHSIKQLPAPLPMWTIVDLK